MEVTRKLLVFSGCILSRAYPDVGGRLNMGFHGAPFISILCIEIIPAHQHHLGSLGSGQERQMTLSMFLLLVETLNTFEFITSGNRVSKAGLCQHRKCWTVDESWLKSHIHDDCKVIPLWPTAKGKDFLRFYSAGNALAFMCRYFVQRLNQVTGGWQKHCAIPLTFTKL